MLLYHGYQSSLSIWNSSAHFWTRSVIIWHSVPNGLGWLRSDIYSIEATSFGGFLASIDFALSLLLAFVDSVYSPLIFSKIMGSSNPYQTPLFSASEIQAPEQSILFSARSS